MSLSQITGHKVPISELKKFVKSGVIPSSLIFYGAEGVGKFRTAVQWAKTINCSHEQADTASLFDGENVKSGVEDVDSCDLCPSCSQIDRGVHPDVRVIDRFFQASLLDEEPEKQKSVKIDTIREALKMVRSRPTLSPKKILIINDADSMTVEAQNSTLKLLEEPAADTIIVLIVSARNLMLPTILSRCQTIKFNPLSTTEVEKVLGGLNIDYNQAAALAKISGGSVRKALDFRELIPIIREKSRIRELAPFHITAALGRELYQVRANARLLLELLTNDLYSKKLTTGDGKIAQGIPPMIKKNLHFMKYLDQNISPRILCELALLEYFRHYDIVIEPGDKQ